MTSLGLITVGIPLPLLLYSSIIFTVCEGKVRFPVLLFGSSVFWGVLKPNIICAFLIHYGSVQKDVDCFYLTLIGIHRKMEIFFECRGKMFLSIEKVLRYVKTNLKSTALLFFSTFLRKNCHIFIELELEKYSKTKLTLNSSQSFKAIV